jgi:hypothetical protein
LGGRNLEARRAEGTEVPYLLPALIAAAPNMTLYITEVEGKADVLAKMTSERRSWMPVLKYGLKK